MKYPFKLWANIWCKGLMAAPLPVVRGHLRTCPQTFGLSYLMHDVGVALADWITCLTTTLKILSTRIKGQEIEEKERVCATCVICSIGNELAYTWTQQQRWLPLNFVIIMHTKARNDSACLCQLYTHRKTKSSPQNLFLTSDSINS